MRLWEGLNIKLMHYSHLHETYNVFIGKFDWQVFVVNYVVWQKQICRKRACILFSSITNCTQNKLNPFST